jgi:hypothetical protein
MAQRGSVFIGGGRLGRNKFLQGLPPAVATQCVTLTAVFNGQPVSAQNPISLTNSMGVNSASVFFNIPSGVGPWSAATWEVAGTGTGGRVGSFNQVHDVPSSGGDTISLPSFTNTGAFDEQGAGSGQQVVDINAAQGAPLTVQLIFNSGAVDGSQSESVTLFTLTLCKPVQVLPVPLKLTPLKSQPILRVPDRPGVRFLQLPLTRPAASVQRLWPGMLYGRGATRDAGKPLLRGRVSILPMPGPTSAPIVYAQTDVLGPRVSRHGFLSAYVSADQVFTVLLKITDDQGATWYVADQTGAGMVLADAGSGTFVWAVEILRELPTYWKLTVSAPVGAHLHTQFAIYDDTDLGS